MMTKRLNYFFGYWMGAIQRLNLALLVAAQHQRVLGRVQVQTDDVVELLDETLVVGEFERLDAMRLDAVFTPDPTHRRGAHAGGIRHRVGGPVGGIRRRGLRGAFDDGANLARRSGRAMTPATRRIFGDAVQTQIEKASTPKRHRLASYANGYGDLFVLKSVAGQQDHLGTLRKTNAGGLGVGNGAQLAALSIGEKNGSGETHEIVPPISPTRPRRLSSLNCEEVH